MNKPSESLENYLKAIYELQRANGSVRSVDIARRLGCSKASVCVAMKKLRLEGLIEMDCKKDIRLTAQGETQAAALRETYLLIKRYLTGVLDVDEQTAARDACRMEHVLSSETLQKTKLALRGM
ncbi:MAG TPA: metal-dependent transcriptional regulator [Eubacteriales bacterium]|nr:metal-dependent transcriptional regulator [Eubacteriales bacterium]